MRKTIFAFLLLASISNSGFAQFSKYIVRFKNKEQSDFSLTQPQAFLSKAAIERRARYQIAYDSTDLPVSAPYINSVKSIPNITLLNVSKWLNAICIHTTDANALKKVMALAFVEKAEPLAIKHSSLFNNVSNIASAKAGKKKLAKKPDPAVENFYQYGFTENEMKIHNAAFLHSIGLRGKGMLIAMLDAGFYHYDVLSAFDSARLQNRILGSWDFVNNEPSVTEDNSHGMECLSNIAANIPGVFVGKAPEAAFYLFKTEDDFSEYPIEEFNWVCGAEKADSAGVDLISSSLGYFVFDNPRFNYNYQLMDGNTAITTHAADLAAKKGILVVNAAGNEAQRSWKYIIAPADADSVLSVAAVNSAGAIGGFSSYGPASDGRVKPDVASVGVSAIVQSTINGQIGASSGTSFACPNMAGLATCLWQGFKEFNNMQIINTIKQASNNYQTPNDRVGYGIPDMTKALIILLKQFATANIETTFCNATISWKSKDAQGMKYIIEKRMNNQPEFVAIDSMGAKGKDFSTQQYQYTTSTEGTMPGSIQFRIKQILDTSTKNFTQIILDTAETTINPHCIANGIDELYFAPNPIINEAVFVMKTGVAIDQLTLRFYDAKGSLVKHLSLNKNTGILIYPISLQGLASGKYFVSIHNKTNLLKTVSLLKL